MNSKISSLAFAILIASSSAGVYAQNEKPDTLSHVVDLSKVIITENASGTKVEIIDAEHGNTVSTVVTQYSPESKVKSTASETNWVSRIKDFDFIYGDVDHGSPWGVSVDGVCIGLTNAVGQSPENGLQWSKSFEISWLSCLNVYYEFSRSRVSLGLGFDWRNYKITTSDKYLAATPAKGIEWVDYAPGAKGRFSRLKVFSLQLPLLYSYDIPKSSLTFKAGPIFNFNTYASLKTVWDDESGDRMESFNKKIDPRRFTVDFFASLSLSSEFGLYVRYSPMKVMDAPNTLNFRPLTIGLTIGI